jgi:hypothetical protein
VKLRRIYPDLKATLLFDESKYKGAHILAKKAMPKNVTPLQDVVI